MVPVAVTSVPALSKGSDWIGAAGRVIAFVEDGSLGDGVPFAAGSPLVH